MSSTPIIGIGDTFSFATVASPTTYTTLDGVQSIDFTGDKVMTEKTTTMSTANGVDTFISATQDPGTVDVKCLFFPGDASQTALEAIRAAGAPVNMKATYGTAHTSSFSGIVESMSKNFPLDKPATLDVKIKITGPITLA